MRTTALALGIVLAAGTAAPVAGADRGIGALKLQIRSRGGVTKLVFASKDPAILFPAIGSADDPATGTPGGATIDVVTADAIASLVVPGGAGWRVKDGTLDTYTYKNSLAPGGPTPVRSVSLREGRTLKIQSRDLPLPTTAPLGAVGVRVTMGSLRSCAVFDAGTIVRDVPGDFLARGALLAIPETCSDTALGYVAVCGNGLVEEGEDCDGAPTATCTAGCDAGCTCTPFCGDGTRDPGEQCDGTSLDPSVVACTYEPGLAEPLCQSDCTCCATLVCSAFGFDAPCCPGFTCPPRVGPNDVSFCVPRCDVDADCGAGRVCLLQQCFTPHCTSNAGCFPGFACVNGVCCGELPGVGWVCG